MQHTASATSMSGACCAAGFPAAYVGSGSKPEFTASQHDARFTTISRSRQDGVNATLGATSRREQYAARLHAQSQTVTPITSSASASSVAGTSSPSALAVLVTGAKSMSAGLRNWLTSPFVGIAGSAYILLHDVWKPKVYSGHIVAYWQEAANSGISA